MNTDFPDEVFDSCVSDSAYDYIAEQGRNICKSKSIFFCGIVRNNAKVLERNLARISRTASSFKNSFTFLYENDSTDNTVDILNKAKSNSTNFDFLSESRADKDYDVELKNGEDFDEYKRCCVLSDCRNKYMDYIKSNNITELYDYICVIDLDIKGGWSYKGFDNSIFMLENIKQAVAMTAYGVIADPYQKEKLEDRRHKDYWMYDTFAFRPVGKDPKMDMRTRGPFNCVYLKKGEKPVEVISNFGGLGIYKSQYFNHNYKVNKWQDWYVDSEHVFFHKQIIDQGGRIFINPSLTVSYVNHKYSEI